MKPVGPKSREALAQVEALEAEAAAAEAELTLLEARQRTLCARLAALRGKSFIPGGGLIEQARLRADALMREELDAEKPIVRWQASWRGTIVEGVISRVTPKRIYLRERGREREVVFTREGQDPTHVYKILDLEEVLRLASKFKAAR